MFEWNSSHSLDGYENMIRQIAINSDYNPSDEEPGATVGLEWRGGSILAERQARGPKTRGSNPARSTRNTMICEFLPVRNVPERQSKIK